MATQPLFDMSKAQPIQGASAPLFDMSKAQPINSGAAAGSPPRGALSRFWEGAKAGTGGENALNTAVDPQHPISSNPMIPGAGVYRDIKGGNYAGAAGRVLGPAAELLPFIGGGRGAAGEAGAEGAAEQPSNFGAKSVVTAPVRVAARATEAVINSKFNPVLKAMTPADEAAGATIKVPGRDFGLPKRGSIKASFDATTSPSRTMPGQVTPEVTSPPQPGAKALRPEDKLLPEMTPSTIDAAVNSPVRTLYGQIPPETGSPRYGPEEMPPNTRPFGPEQQRALPAAPQGAELGDLSAPKAQQSNPADALFGVGQKPVQATEAPTSMTRRSLQQYRDMLGRQLGDSLGAKSPIDNPKAPIVQRGQKTELPEGHTAVDSSALRSYKYDPAKQEFEAWPTSGETAYRYGEVSPDAAKAFEDAPSKGKAFQQIKNSGTLVAKRVNGQWVPIKPARGSIAEGMKK